MPPENSITVKVNGKAWTRVNSLEHSARTDSHFLLDPTSGRVAFGDGLSGRRPPKGARIEVSYRLGSGAVAFRAQPLCGVFRGVVVLNVDPVARMRLLVQVPDAGITSSWAAACLPAGIAALPSPGDHVWVTFENGDADRPVWFGVTPA